MSMLEYALLYPAELVQLTAFMHTSQVIVFFCLACGLTLLPIAFLEDDNLPEAVTFNITEHNICFWTGSKGFLDKLNPCPYRGYIGNDKVSIGNLMKR